MAKIIEFIISNFKGATSVSVGFGRNGNANVVTLIGLNESGKTTILEAISQFTTRDEVVTKFFDTDLPNRFNSYVPVDRKAAFTGFISIEAKVELSDEDIDDIAEIFEKGGMFIDRGAVRREIRVERRFTYNDSEYAPAEFLNYWTNLNFSYYKSKKSVKLFTYDRPKDKSQTDYWHETTKLISKRLPNIVYFPTFLVEVPSKIYLVPHPDETPQNLFYRNIFQNVLDSLPDQISLQRHVVERLSSFKASNPIATWFSILLGDPTKRNLDAVFLKISTAITREVLGSWSKIFNRPVSAKRVDISWSIDSSKNDMPYASISVSDGESPYALNERSLGFRWFFTFLLFTRYGGSQSRPNLFLFDEPAANLHARAQAELLQSFGKIVSGGNQIIYSTHSHHMINPVWLSGAYIVNNEAIDYESESAGADFSVRPTKINATSYRRFVGEHGNQTSYFQPVLERLMYLEPSIAATGPQILVEGPSDFYALSIVKRGKDGYPIIVPGGGAGSLDPLISLALSRSYPFVILMDGDDEGKTQRKRYIDLWSIPSELIITLDEIFPSLRSCELESIISPDDKKCIAELYGSAGKKQIQSYLAEIHFKGGMSIGKTTSENFTKILDACRDRFPKGFE